MKTVLVALVAALFLCALPGCYVYPEPVPYPEAGYPAYVYSYPNGCWADDVWYAPCPWAPGPAFGYYLWYGGGYHFHAGAVWGYRPGYPPPMHWHRYYGPPGYRYAPPARHYAPAHPHPYAPPPPRGSGRRF